MTTAYGITGNLKNALDGVVGNVSFVSKPPALWNVSPREVHARASLLEIVTADVGTGHRTGVDCGADSRIGNG